MRYLVLVGRIDKDKDNLIISRVHISDAENPIQAEQTAECLIADKFDCATMALAILEEET